VTIAAAHRADAFACAFLSVFGAAHDERNVNAPFVALQRDILLMAIHAPGMLQHGNDAVPCGQRCGLLGLVRLGVLLVVRAVHRKRRGQQDRNRPCPGTE